MIKVLPRANSNVITPDGPGKVLKIEVLKQKVLVRLNDENIMTYHQEEITNKPTQPKTLNS